MRRRAILTMAAVSGGLAACSDPAPEAAPPAPSVTSAAPSATAAPRPSVAPRKSAPPSKAATAPATRTVARGGPVPASDRVMLGSYMALSGMSLRESLALRRRQLGREQRIVHRFAGWSERLPTSVLGLGDGTLMISWHAPRMESVTGGGSDGLIRSAARRLAAYGKPVLLRWGWEMNGDWFDWGGDPSGYVTAHRRIHRIFRANGAGNVAFVWSPNWNSAPDTSANAMERYYPGDDHVDWVGVSGYDFYSESPRTLFKHVVSAYGRKKPIVVTETAAIDHGAGSKAAWIRDLSSYVRRTPAIAAVVWFDTDVQEDSDENFRFDTSADALAAYRTMARSARFSG